MKQVAILLFVLISCTSLTAQDKPNIVIFLADDLGYADIGVNGCKDIPTPNIDSIANNGRQGWRRLRNARRDPGLLRWPS